MQRNEFARKIERIDALSNNICYSFSFLFLMYYQKDKMSQEYYFEILLDLQQIFWVTSYTIFQRRRYHSSNNVKSYNEFSSDCQVESGLQIPSRNGDSAMPQSILLQIFLKLQFHSKNADLVLLHSYL